MAVKNTTAKVKRSDLNRSEPVLYKIEQNVPLSGRGAKQEMMLLRKRLDEVVPKLRVGDSFPILAVNASTVRGHLNTVYSSWVFRVSRPKGEKFGRVWRIA